RHSSHKNANGAPGQPVHSLHEPKSNDKYQGSGLRRTEGIMERYGQTETKMANKRSVWTVPGEDDPLLLYLMENMDEDQLNLLLEQYVADLQNMGSVLRITPEQLKYAHFAAFPRAFVEPMILAGCPPVVCSKCGTPWTRQIEKTFVPQEDVSANRVD